MVVLFAYEIKLNNSRRKRVRKILPKGLYCHFNLSLQCNKNFYVKAVKSFDLGGKQVILYRSFVVFLLLLKSFSLAQHWWQSLVNMIRYANNDKIGCESKH